MKTDETANEMRESKRMEGLQERYIVSRVDGRSAPGEKHDGCWYFVLDVTHDPFAIPALLAYADATQWTYPLLADDLRTKAAEAAAKLHTEEPHHV